MRNRERELKGEEIGNKQKSYPHIIVWAVFSSLCTHCAYARMNICIHTSMVKMNRVPNVPKSFLFRECGLCFVVHRIPNVPFFHLLL